jgi:hypothetical protein
MTNDTSEQDSKIIPEISPSISKGIDETTSVRQHVASVEDSRIVGVAVSDIQFSSPLLGTQGRVNIKFPPRQSTFYSVTEAEIEIYAQLNLFANICLTLFGLLAGFSLGCVAALAQGNIPDPGKTALTWLVGIAGIIAIVFLILSLFLAFAQHNSKKFWRSDKT